MARKKTPATRVNVKAQISNRLREVRQEIFGEHGGPELARRLTLPARTWYNYETGVTVPAEVLLGFIDQTGANPIWLLSGKGPRFENHGPGPTLDEMSPQQLIRRSLEKLEQERGDDDGKAADYVSLDVVSLGSLGGDDDPIKVEGRVLADHSWIRDARSTVAARLRDDAMAPILPSGSIVAIDLSSRDPLALVGRLTAVRVNGHAMVRWLERTGKHLILRPNQSREEFPILPLEGDGPSSATILGQVVWSWSLFAAG